MKSFKAVDHRHPVLKPRLKIHRAKHYLLGLNKNKLAIASFYRFGFSMGLPLFVNYSSGALSI
jgi:hypothetical protein